jgi:phage host-nuclease inhibitor protein Gam
MKNTKSKTKSRITLPRITIADRTDADLRVGEYTHLTITLQKITADMEAEILKIRERCAPEIEAIEAERKALTNSLCDWATAHPEEFAKNRKSIDFAAGTIGFRTGGPKLALLNRKWTWEKALTAVQSVLPNFIRNKPEIDKESIVAQSADLNPVLPLCGLAVVQDESFYVDPKIDQPAPTTQTNP